MTFPNSSKAIAPKSWPTLRADGARPFRTGASITSPIDLHKIIVNQSALKCAVGKIGSPRSNFLIMSHRKRTRNRSCSRREIPLKLSLAMSQARQNEIRSSAIESYLRASLHKASYPRSMISVDSTACRKSDVTANLRELRGMTREGKNQWI